MSRKHRWTGNQCIKCGLLRERKTRKLLMAITNHPPYDHYKYEQYFEYNDGFKKMDKRPDCKPNRNNGSRLGEVAEHKTSIVVQNLKLKTNVK